MAKIKVDFTGVEATAKCEEGEHIAVLKSIEEKQSQGGNDMLSACFEVTAGVSAGSRVYDNFVLGETSLWKLKLFLECIDMKAEGKVAIDTDKMLGKKCIISVSHEEYNGQKRAKIQEYKKLAAPAAKKDAPGKAPAADEDEWDEA